MKCCRNVTVYIGVRMISGGKQLILERTRKLFYLSGWIAKAVRMEYAKRTSQERILIVERG